MAVEEIPVFREARRGQVVRSADWNGMQQQLRNSVRTHRHTRVDGDPVDDTVPDDLALQITTGEIADGAVTGDKIADGVIQIGDLHPDLQATIEGATELGDDAVQSAMVAEADGTSAQDTGTGAGIKTGHLQDGAVSSAKIADGAIEIGDLHPDLQAAIGGAAELGDDAVSSAMIAEADGTTGQDTNTGQGVKTGHLQNAAVNGPKIAAGAVSIGKLNTGLRGRINQIDGAAQMTTGIEELAPGELFKVEHGFGPVPIAITLGVFALDNRLAEINPDLVGDFETYGLVPNLQLEENVFAAAPVEPDGTFFIVSTAQDDRAVRWWALARTEDIP